MVDAVADGWARADAGRSEARPPGDGRVVVDRVVVDVATGTAGVAIQLARRLDARVVGVDLSGDMLTEGARRVADTGLAGRIHLVRARGEALPFRDSSVPALTFTYLLRYVSDPAATLVELARVVRPGGTVSSLEFLAPPSRFWRLWWWLYTRTVLPLAGLLTGGRPWYDVGRFLGPNISGHYRLHPVERHVAMWREDGLDDVHVRAMSLGGGLVMWGRKREG